MSSKTRQDKTVKDKTTATATAEYVEARHKQNMGDREHGAGRMGIVCCNNTSLMYRGGWLLLAAGCRLLVVDVIVNNWRLSLAYFGW